ncbi:MAG: hypothetical protein N7Q72_01305, partial [Spiroplasma sp. Tabriz.8]|nr:hypothetical protein [Spiroplasma sp. Tabriz.8]
YLFVMIINSIYSYIWLYDIIFLNIYVVLLILPHTYFFCIIYIYIYIYIYVFFFSYIMHIFFKKFKAKLIK